VVSWTNLIYDTAEGIVLRVRSASLGVGNGEGFSPTIAVNLTIDADGTLTAAGTVAEPVALPSTASAAGLSVNLFDFTLADGGTVDGLSFEVSQVVLHTSGTGPFDKVNFRLNGPDASNVAGTYNSGANTLTFGGLSISVPNSASETYTVNAYYTANTGITDHQTLGLSLDGDVDLTISATGTQRSGANAVVNNGAGSEVEITATKLVFTTPPAGSISGQALTTQPVVEAQDDFGNVDVDFDDPLTLTETAGGVLSNNTATTANGMATFSGLTYRATVDGEAFTLTADDEAGGAEGDLPTSNAAALNSDVIATHLVFTAQPAGVDGVGALTNQPVVAAQDADGVIDTDFADTIQLTESGPGTLSNDTVAAVNGTALFTDLIYTTPFGGETFTITADDDAGRQSAGGGIQSLNGRGSPQY